ncbi:MAG: chemotaxis-specific protein-glutamate methyltransferase CheB [candidate division NC10 bacterium]|nr:chemotaxis-specific protein-glutamate methyltransferase CheB [candidate division NC10 bacterium]
MIRVLVAEDSAVTRQEALEQAEQLKPDVILMDVHMPRLDGYEATRRIMERIPTPIVMVSASLDRDEVAISFEALKAGAVTLVDKPRGPDHPAQAESARRLVETVKLMAEVKVVRRFPRRERPVTPPSFPGPSDRTIRLVAIAASTGGPQVLAEILAGLQANFAPAILIVQHIAPGFTEGLAQWLGHATPLEVKVSAPAEGVRPGVVYLAPEGYQMGITKDGRIRLTKDLFEDGFRPSASYLFHSVAEAYGRSAVGVVLTGMGRDGASGLRQLREAGGVTIAQDETTSVVFGMPAEAIRLGAAEYILPRGQIAPAIRSLVTRG